MMMSDGRSSLVAVFIVGSFDLFGLGHHCQHAACLQTIRLETDCFCKQSFSKEIDVANLLLHSFIPLSNVGAVR